MKLQCLFPCPHFIIFDQFEDLKIHNDSARTVRSLTDQGSFVKATRNNFIREYIPMNTDNRLFIGFPKERFTFHGNPISSEFMEKY